MSDLWFALPNLEGRLIRLEPLELHHAEGYLSAAGTGSDAAEVFRWLNPPGGGLAEPVTIEDAERHILAALAARARGERFPYAQIDVRTGDFAGTTSYYEVNPAAGLSPSDTPGSARGGGAPGTTRSPSCSCSATPSTPSGRSASSGTPMSNNTRSQAAIERLGAIREGVLRKHRMRFDGSWRDTVQYAMTDEDWPAARAALAARLTAAGRPSLPG